MPGPYPNTGSTIYKNQTGVALSTNILIKAGGNAVGAIQSIQITESRQIKMIDELGTDGHIDSAPERSTEITGQCTRIRFDRIRIFQAFGRDFIHIKSQRIPFTIEIHDTWAGDDANKIITVLSDVWFDSMNYTYSGNDWVISESANFKAEDIYSVYNGTGEAVGTKDPGGNGSRSIQTEKEVGTRFQLEADGGKRRGAIDGAGLINAAFVV
jgi:hypothetical protein